ncbi:MAG: 30S ribosomal protein S17e [Candidatus Woesearchaeota archaeon]
MGRIKTKQIKRITNDLMTSYGSNFGKDYLENRKLVEQYLEIRSKKLRNTIAGYSTRLLRKQIGQ